MLSLGWLEILMVELVVQKISFTEHNSNIQDMYITSRKKLTVSPKELSDNKFPITVSSKFCCYTTNGEVNLEVDLCRTCGLYSAASINFLLDFGSIKQLECSVGSRPH